ncbi:MAG TPA: NAD(P)H-dependent oxidoreductase [Candidatus Paceibacterota bacterium]
MAKKIFILVGHPDEEPTLTAKLADSYEAGAVAADHEVRRMNIGEMHFDPILHRGYKVIQELEPDLKTFQENVKWCDHLVVLYPNWWGTMPALLKGLIDRTWLPGFAFRFNNGSTLLWEKLLKGRSARLIVVANTHPWAAWFLFGEFTNELSRATLGFSGIRPVHIKVFSPSEKASDAKRTGWFDEAYQMGQAGK